MTDIAKAEERTKAIASEVEQLKGIEELFSNLRQHGHLLDDSDPLDPDIL